MWKLVARSYPLPPQSIKNKNLLFFHMCDLSNLPKKNKLSHSFGGIEFITILLFYYYVNLLENVSAVVWSDNSLILRKVFLIIKNCFTLIIQWNLLIYSFKILPQTHSNTFSQNIRCSGGAKVFCRQETKYRNSRGS